MSSLSDKQNKNLIELFKEKTDNPKIIQSIEHIYEILKRFKAHEGLYNQMKNRNKK